MQENLCPNCFQPLDANTKFCPNCGFSGQSNQEKYPVAIPAGTILAGRYIVGKVLGQGGFGITYLALDYQTKEKVALKEYFPETMVTRTEALTVSSYAGDREENFNYGKDCFLEEAKTLAEFIGNDNIVRVYSYFEENGTAYFAMEYIEGESLQEYITRKGGRIPFDDAKRILFPIMDALSSVHAKGIVHRDISPDNIYICKDNSIKLLDFGAARYSLGDKSRSLDVVLKHGYAPKEQYTRRGRQGPFTDVYSIAATFYRAITGQTPPDSIDRIDNDELVPPSQLGVSIPPKAEEALLKALAVQPEQRFQNIDALKNAMSIASADSNATVDGSGITFFDKTPGASTPGASAQTGNAAYPNTYAPTSQNGYPTSQNGYPTSQNGYPTSQNGYPASQNGYPTSQNGYPTSQNGYPTSQNGYPTSQNGYPTTQNGYPTTQNGYPTTTMQNGYMPPNNGYNNGGFNGTGQTPPKSKKKWLIPVIIGTSVLLTILLILIPVLTCSGGNKPTPTPTTSPDSSSGTFSGFFDSTTAPSGGNWVVSVAAANTDENDEDTLMTTVKPGVSYFHVDFYVSKGDSSNPITVSYVVDTGTTTTDKKTWDDVEPEDTLTVYWSNGFSKDTEGTVTIILYNEDDGGAKLCDFTFEITDGTSSGGTSSGGKTYNDATGATIHVGDTWEVDGLFFITINSITETTERNKYDTTDPAAVYIVDFTYGNIGCKEDEVYFSFTLDTKDAAGKDVDYYTLTDVSVNPDFLAMGETLHCTQVIAVSKAGTVTSTQWAYDGLTRYEADFVLEP
ncbi:MAG: protein kinase [Ruminococcus sp.]|nr:protein kinase [Ruminococcus sp.]